MKSIFKMPSVDYSEFHIWYFLIEDIKKANMKSNFRTMYCKQHQNMKQNATNKQDQTSTTLSSPGDQNKLQETCNQTFHDHNYSKEETYEVYGKRQAVMNYDKFVEKSHDVTNDVRHFCASCVASRIAADTGCQDAGSRVRTQTSTFRTAYAQFLAGAVGGCTATYTTHWLDTVKVRMQTFPGHYKSSIVCLRETLMSEGVRGLYMGASPALLGHTVKAAIVFMSYGLCEGAVCSLTGKTSTEQMSISEHASAGALTGVLASFLLCPMELVKCRLQAAQCASVAGDTVARHPIGVTWNVMSSEGFRGLYRGLPGIWVKDVPGSFIYFGSYEMAKSICKSIEHTAVIGNCEVFICGMIAGLCYCVTHPIETVKTRVQVATPGTERKGFFRSFIHILKSEGMRPLWNGLRPSMLRSCLFSGIQFLVYEFAKESIINHSMQSH